MSPDQGGAFSILLLLVRAGLGGKAASGNQFVSWVHDRTSSVLLISDRAETSGRLHQRVCAWTVAEHEFMRSLRQAWGAGVGLPATKWMLEIGAFFLRTETELILKSRRVVPQRLPDSGFEFCFSDWPSAARDLVSRWRKR